MQFKPLTLAMSVPLIPILAVAAYSDGWALYALMLATMILIFGSIPFTDAMIVRYVDDRLRSRVAGMRLAVSAGISAIAVWLLGPVVKNAGFDALFWLMVAIAVCRAGVLLWLPREPKQVEPVPAPAR
jgi:predicted MFS family arabinose efflux permease